MAIFLSSDLPIAGGLVVRSTAKKGMRSVRSQIKNRSESRSTVQNTRKDDNRRDHRMKTGKGSNTNRLQPLALGNQSALESVRERFASAILAGNRNEIDQILHEIAKLSPPSDSPKEFFQLMTSLLIRAWRSAVKQHVVQEELRNLAITDDLTGLHNRRGFFALAGQLLKFARRNHGCALLFFADVDGLKQINDRFGHSEGDLAINRVAQILRDTFRDSDVIARLGGDEFAVLANEASSDSQRDIWRRLKKNLSEEGSRNRLYSLSLSIGVARFNPCSQFTLGELLEYADRAMYEAKRTAVDARFLRNSGKHFASRISPDESRAGNAISPASSKDLSTVPLAPKPNSQAKVTLLFANLPGRRGTLVGA